MNIEMIRAAAQRLEGQARRTPLLSSPFLDEIAGRRLWVKPECLQHTGSFKFRGAYNALAAMDAQVRKRGVIAFPRATTRRVWRWPRACMACPPSSSCPPTAPR
jgi:Threonine dehydratase